MAQMSVLWLTGAPGVGKSTAGWALYSLAKAEGLPVGYVDIDQLGLLLPAPTGDPDYHRVKAANLVAVLETFRRHGAQQLIVSGVVDTERGIEPYARVAADVEFSLIRLTCTREELRRRYLGRGSTAERLDELMDLVDALERNAVGTPLDTTAMAPPAIAEMLADRIRRVGPAQPTVPAPVVPPEEPAPVLLLAGPTAVGKSTVGWEVLQILRERGIRAGFVDVDQFGFYPSDSAAKIKVESLQRVWRGYRGAGARALIVVARGAPQAYEQALADELVTTAYLEASPSVLAERIAERGRGLVHGLAGDSLAGASVRQQARTLERSGEEVAVLRQQRGDALVINTDHETSSAVAAKLAEVFRSDEG